MQLLDPKKPQPEEERSVVSKLDTSLPSAIRRTSRNVYIILRREYKVRVFQRSFVISTAISMLFAMLILLVPSFIQLFFSSSSRPEVENTVVIIEPDDLLKEQNLTSYLNHAFNPDLDSNSTGSDSTSIGQSSLASVVTAGFRKPNPGETETDLRKKTRDGKINGYMVAARNEDGDLTFKYYSSSKNTNYYLDDYLPEVLKRLTLNDRLQRAGLSSAEIDRIVAPSNLDSTVLGPEEPSNASNSGGTAGPDNSSEASSSDNSEANSSRDAPPKNRLSTLLPLILAFTLFGSVFAYGQMVGAGAAEEKSNRIIELMVSAATPFQLMMGKILGIGLVGLTQLALLGVASISALLLQVPLILLLGADRLKSSTTSTAAMITQASGAQLNSASLNQVAGSSIQTLSLPFTAILFFPVFYALGFVLWATLFAAAGSLASRQEDVSIALTPVMSLTLTNYLPLFVAMVNFNTPWVVIFSYIPIYMPSMMIARLAYGSAAWWEGLIGAIVLLFWIILFTWLSARVYRAGVLIYGTKPTFRRLLKLMFWKSR